jgi:N-acetylneuraminate lyase
MLELHQPNNPKNWQNMQNKTAHMQWVVWGRFFYPLPVWMNWWDFVQKWLPGHPACLFIIIHILRFQELKSPWLNLFKRQKQIPNLAGIKFTDNNFMDMQQCLRLDNGRWDILHGYDEQLLAGLAFGAKGAVGSTYNFIAPLYYGVMKDFENGNLDAAREKQAIIHRVVEILNKYGGAIACGKALMKQVGVDCGPCRLPMKNLQGKNYKNFVNEIESIGVLKPEKSGV